MDIIEEEPRAPQQSASRLLPEESTEILQATLSPSPQDETHSTNTLDLGNELPRSSSNTSTPPFNVSDDPPLKLIDILLARLEVHLAKRRILSLDGGGVRGAFTVKILTRMEEATKKSIKDLFQGSITGTSTGSFIALGLVFPDKEGVPNAGPYTARDILNFYVTRSSHMFSNCCAFSNSIGALKYSTSPLKILGCFGCCYNCNGLCVPKYTRKALDKELQTLFGETRRLSEALSPVQVTTYDIGQGGDIMHLSSTDQHTNQYQFHQAAAASSAAPTYYPCRPDRK